MITRGELKGRVLRILNKTAQFRGLYDDGKLDDAIQECLDFVATEMHLAGEGGQTKIQYIDTQAGQITVPIHPSVALVKEVRYRYGDVYLVMPYDDATGQNQVAYDSGERQDVCRYRVVDNRLYFNAPLNEGGTGYLMIEYMSFPKVLADDTDFLEGHFNPCFQHFMKYRIATIMAASAEKMALPWAGLEAQWYTKLLALTSRRNMQPTPLRMFGD